MFVRDWWFFFILQWIFFIFMQHTFLPQHMYISSTHVTTDWLWRHTESWGTIWDHSPDWTTAILTNRRTGDWAPCFLWNKWRWFNWAGAWSWSIVNYVSCLLLSVYITLDVCPLLNMSRSLYHPKKTIRIFNPSTLQKIIEICPSPWIRLRLRHEQ